MSDLAQTEPLLETRWLNKSFRGLRALRDNNLSILHGEIAGVIEPNGSGKSTLFNVITGFTPPTSGEVYFKGQRITGNSPAGVVERGIARTFQGARLFGSEGRAALPHLSCKRRSFGYNLRAIVGKKRLQVCEDNSAENCKSR
ncbi:MULTISPECIES: ATP-binding cassette domain-containing protein [Mesorhizobium]|uniref:ATP-binding cassette domain-containing protein n=1 Tax=Mesorhizobium TaxID=68287 RepID=UPI0010A96F5D|nr:MULTISPECIES: ATP-binding cassette domain-containing protein [Mesorhizobium]